ncbi:DUF3775 domain-containing protein [Cypionkella sp.]|uniref:DUF3775 domain-containing protein n=1 Tax=Cypionkella sp. TaxID=2811411 RepID=UPI00261D0316|nr:DUF3775 domain-containing protein [Cypionkella sp.]MDB5664199.1 hypothetical protein [Cypionkella sp.]
MLEIAPAKVVEIIYLSRETTASAAAELRGLLAGLNVDETSHLTALAWVGRGTYTAEEFGAAVVVAQVEATAPAVEYLLGMTDLAENLEAGLEEMGIDVTGEEEDLL